MRYFSSEQYRNLQDASTGFDSQLHLAAVDSDARPRRIDAGRRLGTLTFGSAQISANAFTSALPPGWQTAPLSASLTVWA